MESYLTPEHYDLVSPDGKIVQIETISPTKRRATVEIRHISPAFVGFFLDPAFLSFNSKSVLAQVGVHGLHHTILLDKKEKSAILEVDFFALSPLGKMLLPLLSVGAFVGKLFAAEESRRVRDPDYLLRMFGRSDRKGRPLLSLGGLEGSGDLILERHKGRTVAFLTLKEGVIEYDEAIYGLLPTLAKALHQNFSHARHLLSLHQHKNHDKVRRTEPGNVLLVKTSPLHIRTVYGRVVPELLPKGVFHTSASILQPDTTDSGDIYELYGDTSQVIDDIPIEFYTLEPHREHIFFSDRDQLVADLESAKSIQDAFATAPQNSQELASVFVVKGTQLKGLEAKDWIVRTPIKHDFPGLSHPSRQALIVEKYIEHQPQYPFLHAIETGLITSQGVLLSRHFPSPLLKRLLLSDLVARSLKRIYFQFPSCSHGQFFSHEDRALLIDLAKFGIPVYWVDSLSQQILQYIYKPDTDSGMFVPLSHVDTFRKATIVGLYGSNLRAGDAEPLLESLLTGLLELRNTSHHPLLQKNTPLALVTGGGPGAMEMGNRVAKKLNILSCANIVDFSQKGNQTVNEQKQNSYIDAKMTYRLDRLVERQADFYLHLPIFLPGGIGTDFEYSLEEVRRKTGAWPPHPILLLGDPAYWKAKITPRFHLNQTTGMIAGSEWVSNCFYAVQTAQEALEVYRRFFEKTLPIGKEGPVYAEGFATGSIY